MNQVRPDPEPSREAAHPGGPGPVASAAPDGDAPLRDGDARLMVLLLLHDVLAAGRAGSPRHVDDTVRQHLHEVCAEARRRGFLVEQLLVALKREWRELPAVRRMPRADATETLARVITLCIHEYYGDHALDPAKVVRRPAGA